MIEQEMDQRKTAVDHKDLEVWQLARDLSIGIHHMTLRELPKFEMYETGSQIRRASKSVRFNIVEGFGRRRYKLEFIKHLQYALVSAKEVEDELDCLFETGSLTKEKLWTELSALNRKLIAKLTAFIQGVERNHRTTPDRPPES